MNGSGVGNVGVQGAQPAPSTPQSIAPQNMNQPYADFAGSFVDIANAIKALSDAKNKDADTYSINTLLGQKLRGMVLENDAKQLDVLLKDVEFKFKGERLSAELTKLYTDIANGFSTGDEIRERINGLVKDNERKQKELDHWQEQFDANLANTKSQTNANNAAANASNASADFTRSDIALQPLRAEVLKQTANNQFSQSRVNYATERMTDIASDLQEVEREIREFKGARDSSNKHWRRLSVYARTQIDDLVNNARSLGLDVRFKDNKFSYSPTYGDDNTELGKVFGLVEQLLIELSDNPNIENRVDIRGKGEHLRYE